MVTRKFLKKFLGLILLSSIGGAALFLPQTGLAESFQISLSKTDTELLLNKVQGAISEKISSDLFTFKPEEQAAIFLVRKSTRKGFLDFCITKLTKDIAKAYLRALLFLYAAPDLNLKAIFDKLESASRKAALQELEDWLNQNQIKTASGELDFSYDSYEKGQQKGTLQYILTFRPLKNQKAEIATEFYSLKSLELISSRGSISIGSPWDIYTYIDEGKTKIDPFIVRVKMGVEEKYGSYVWDKSFPVNIEVEFPNEVPDIRPEKVSLSGKIKLA
ncbi:MAG: hypothetical protein COT36_01020, partial [Parcubacteria group bacterium CG08_land_8_20_14_0_20_38_56]